jgi:hypothetical protein
MVEPAPTSTSSSEVAPKPAAPVQKTALEMDDKEYAALKKQHGIRKFPSYLGQSS